MMNGLSPKANFSEASQARGGSAAQFYKWRERAYVGIKNPRKTEEGPIEQSVP